MGRRDTESTLQVLGLLRGVVGDYIGYKQSEKDRLDRRAQQDRAYAMQQDQLGLEKTKATAALGEQGWHAPDPIEYSATPSPKVGLGNEPSAAPATGIDALRSAVGMGPNMAAMAPAMGGMANPRAAFKPIPSAGAPVMPPDPMAGTPAAAPFDMNAAPLARLKDAVSAKPAPGSALQLTPDYTGPQMKGVNGEPLHFDQSRSKEGRLFQQQDDLAARRAKAQQDFDAQKNSRTEAQDAATLKAMFPAEYAKVSAEPNASYSKALAVAQAFGTADRTTARTMGAPHMTTVDEIDPTTGQVKKKAVNLTGKDGQIIGDEKPAAVGGHGSASITKALATNKMTLTKIDAAIKALQDNPDATGLKGFVPTAILDRAPATRDSAQVDTRARVGDIGSLIIHNRAGSAQTLNEMRNMKDMLPKTTAPADQNIIRLRQLRESIQAETDALGGGGTSPVMPAPKAPPPGHDPDFEAFLAGKKP